LLRSRSVADRNIPRASPPHTDRVSIVAIASNLSIVRRFSCFFARLLCHIGSEIMCADRMMALNQLRSYSDSVEPAKLSSPRIFLFRMLVFLTLCALLLVVLYKQVWGAFMANPGLNGVILGVLAIGILLAFRQVIRLYPEIRWVNEFRISDPGLAIDRRPTLLAPMAVLLGDRTGRTAITQQTMRHLLDSIATRLDEARDLSRYMTGLLVFLGLLGTFWGLIETVGSVGKVIDGLQVGGEAGSIFDSLKEGLAAPLGGMGIAFSSSLFGLAGSLILGFLDLQTSQAQNAFYTDLEDWMTSMTELDHPMTQMQASGLGVSSDEMSAMLAQFGSTMQNANSSQNSIRAMAELARGIDGLVKHIKAEQEDLRGHIIQQGETNRKLQALMEAMIREAEAEKKTN